MNINKIYIDGYKNLEDININPSKNINIFYGDNAQGKTNLLEAINLFCGKKEFSNFKDVKVVNFLRDMAVMNIQYDDEQREIKSEIAIGNKNKFLMNKVDLKRLSEFSKYLKSVTFSPEYMEIVDGGSQNRRKFLDSAIFQIRHDYIKYLRDYNRVLKQKNALLKNHQNSNDYDIWDKQLARLGVIITLIRVDYINKLKPICEDIYFDISAHKEELNIFYHSSVFEEKIDEKYTQDKVMRYYQKLKDNRQEDIVKKYTGYGVHRDDIIFHIEDKKARDYGSRGQRRSCVIALKLSEAKLLKRIKKINPIILLDDIMSELDKNRQEFILNKIKDNQVFITCCDITNTLSLQNGNIYHIKKGKINKL